MVADLDRAEAVMTGQEIVEWLGDNGPTYDHAEADQIGKLERFLASIDFPRTALIVWSGRAAG